MLGTIAAGSAVVTAGCGGDGDAETEEQTATDEQEEPEANDTQNSETNADGESSGTESEDEESEITATPSVRTVGVTDSVSELDELQDGTAVRITEQAYAGFEYTVPVGRDGTVEHSYTVTVADKSGENVYTDTQEQSDTVQEEGETVARKGQVTLPMDELEPGTFTIAFEVTDDVSGETAGPAEAEFDILPRAPEINQVGLMTGEDRHDQLSEDRTETPLQAQTYFGAEYDVPVEQETGVVAHTVTIEILDQDGAVVYTDSYDAEDTGYQEAMTDQKGWFRVAETALETGAFTARLSIEDKVTDRTTEQTVEFEVTALDPIIEDFGLILEEEAFENLEKDIDTLSDPTKAVFGYRVRIPVLDGRIDIEEKLEVLKGDTVIGEVGGESATEVADDIDIERGYAEEVPLWARIVGTNSWPQGELTARYTLTDNHTGASTSEEFVFTFDRSTAG